MSGSLEPRWADSPGSPTVRPLWQRPVTCCLRLGMIVIVTEDSCRPDFLDTRFDAGQVDDRVVTAELVGHIGVGSPIVFPAVTVEQVSEAIRPSSPEEDTDDEMISVTVHRC